MILVDCSQLTAHEKLELASRISDSFEGLAIALVKGESIVLDDLSKEKPEPSSVKKAVAGFVSKWKDAGHYTVELAGDRIIVHSSNRATAKEKAENTLPPNLKQCPYCAFVTQYEEQMTVHVRAHLFGV